jgi:hypothetical protein
VIQKNTIQLFIFVTVFFGNSVESSLKSFFQKHKKTALVAAGSVVILGGFLGYSYKKSIDGERKKIADINAQLMNDDLLVQKWIDFSKQDEQKEFFGGNKQCLILLNTLMCDKEKIEKMKFLGDSKPILNMYQEYQNSFRRFLYSYFSAQYSFIKKAKEVDVFRDNLPYYNHEFEVASKDPSKIELLKKSPFNLVSQVVKNIRDRYTLRKKILDKWIYFYKALDKDSQYKHTSDMLNRVLETKDNFEKTLSIGGVNSIVEYAAKYQNSFFSFLQSYCEEQQRYFETIDVCDEEKDFFYYPLPKYIITEDCVCDVFDVRKDFQKCPVCLSFTRKLHFPHHDAKMCKSCFDGIQQDYEKNCAACPICRGVMIANNGVISCDSQKEVKKIAPAPSNTQPSRDDLIEMGIPVGEINANFGQNNNNFGGMNQNQLVISDLLFRFHINRLRLQQSRERNAPFTDQAAIMIELSRIENELAQFGFHIARY